MPTNATRNATLSEILLTHIRALSADLRELPVPQDRTTADWAVADQLRATMRSAEDLRAKLLRLHELQQGRGRTE